MKATIQQPPEVLEVNPPDVVARIGWAAYRLRNAGKSADVPLRCEDSPTLARLLTDRAEALARAVWDVENFDQVRYVMDWGEVYEYLHTASTLAIATAAAVVDPYAPVAAMEQTSRLTSCSMTAEHVADRF